MSVAAGVSDAAIAVRDKLRGKIGQTKVKRYWPGKAPEWAAETEDDDAAPDFRSAVLERALPTRASLRRDDRRLRRLAQLRADNGEEARGDRRRIRQGEVVSALEEESSKPDGADLEEEDEDALEERRRRIRENLLQAALLSIEEEEAEAEEEEEESEYETDSEEEQTGFAMAKPVFVPISERDTIAERERLEEEKRRIEEMAKRRIEQRRSETKQIVVEEIRKDQQIRKNLESEANVTDMDTDAELNEAEEYEAWKAREIARIKRGIKRDRDEIEKVRNVTEGERREWERKNPKPLPQPKQKRRFMQKYYHKGAFFQADADDRIMTAGSDTIYSRDFSDPTGEDKMDKTILPKVMQVRHFGRKGRTKWSHLVNEDTTDWDSPVLVYLLRDQCTIAFRLIHLNLWSLLDQRRWIPLM